MWLRTELGSPESQDLRDSCSGFVGGVSGHGDGFTDTGRDDGGVVKWFCRFTFTRGKMISIRFLRESKMELNGDIGHAFRDTVVQGGSIKGGWKEDVIEDWGLGLKLEVSGGESLHRSKFVVDKCESGELRFLGAE
jgi:hypothetical protein